MTLAAEARRIGHCTLFKAISQGGTASVHYGLLHSGEGDPRPVAIKRLLPALMSEPMFTTMLVDEARIAGSVKHPNVVPILDVIHDGEEPLLVLEYVHGLSVAHLLRLLQGREARVPPAIAATIAVDALRGIHAAHEACDEAGQPLCIVHRDISPQNILLDVDGTAKVTDFGVAKARGRLQRTTETGTLKGKLGYVSPEQVHGDVDRRSDLFSMGIVLWEMLVGARLYSGDSEAGILGKILSGRIEPPSRRGAELSRELELVLMKSLERDRELRFDTAEAMADAISAATKLATHAEVAAFVEDKGREVLAQRARIVEQLRQMAPPFPRPPLRRKHSVLLLAAALACGSGALAVVMGERDRRVELAPAAAAATIPAAIAADVAAPVVERRPDVSFDLAVALADAGPSVAPIPAARRVETRAPSPRTIKRSAPDCSVPYEIDAEGRKTWRRECFKKGAK